MGHRTSQLLPFYPEGTEVFDLAGPQRQIKRNLSQPLFPVSSLPTGRQARLCGEIAGPHGTSRMAL